MSTLNQQMEQHVMVKRSGQKQGPQNSLRANFRPGKSSIDKELLGSLHEAKAFDESSYDTWNVAQPQQRDAAFSLADLLEEDEDRSDKPDQRQTGYQGMLRDGATWKASTAALWESDKGRISSRQAGRDTDTASVHSVDSTAETVITSNREKKGNTDGDSIASDQAVAGWDATAANEVNKLKRSNQAKRAVVNKADRNRHRAPDMNSAAFDDAAAVGCWGLC
jgi:hypothetical protein